MKIETDLLLEGAKLSADGTTLVLREGRGDLFTQRVRPGMSRLALRSPATYATSPFATPRAKSSLSGSGRAGTFVKRRSPPKLLFDIHYDDLHGSIACSRDGRFVAAVDDTAVHIWDRDQGRDFVVGPRRPASVGVLAVAPDGKEFVSGGDQDAYAWSLPRGEAVQVLEERGRDGRWNRLLTTREGACSSPATTTAGSSRGDTGRTDGGSPSLARQPTNMACPASRWAGTD